jgi:hypothetical protein
MLGRGVEHLCIWVHGRLLRPVRHRLLRPRRCLSAVHSGGNPAALCCPGRVRARASALPVLRAGRLGCRVDHDREPLEGLSGRGIVRLTFADASQTTITPKAALDPPPRRLLVIVPAERSHPVATAAVVF